MKSLLIDTVPRDAENRGSINLGLEIVRKKWNADVAHWWDIVDDIDKYDRIGFNILYTTHMADVWPFLQRNALKRNWAVENVMLIAGGPGVNKDVMNEMVDATFMGEIDDECRWEILSEPVIVGHGLPGLKHKAVVELSRGCMWRCAFCEYSHARAYRVKPFDLVKRQVDEVLAAGCRRINFMSADFAGYPHISELLEYAVGNGIQIMNSDFRVASLPKIMPWMDHLQRRIKIGVESFDEKTRLSIKKPFSDEFFANLLEDIMRKTPIANIHILLIYGLPGDNYDSWFHWLEKLVKIRKKAAVRNLRYDFKIANFVPYKNTPLRQAQPVNFTEKAIFVKKWAETMIKHGLFVGKELVYANAKGMLGTDEGPYRMLLTMLNGDAKIVPAMQKAFPNGVSSSTSKQWKRFMKEVEK